MGSGGRMRRPGCCSPLEEGMDEIAVLHRREGDEHPYAVPVSITAGGVEWVIGLADTAVAGTGVAEVIYKQGGAVAKSVTYTTRCDESIDDGEIIVPTAAESWVQYVAELTASAQLAERGAEAAAEAAQGSKEAAEAAAQTAEAQAVRAEQAAAGIGEAADQAEQARDSAVQAAGEALEKANAAQESAGEAALQMSYARGYAAEAREAKEAADVHAQTAASYSAAAAESAGSSQNSAENAATSAESAQTSAQEAQTAAEQARVDVSAERAAREAADSRLYESITEISDDLSNFKNGNVSVTIEWENGDIDQDTGAEQYNTNFKRTGFLDCNDMSSCTINSSTYRQLYATFYDSEKVRNDKATYLQTDFPVKITFPNNSKYVRFSTRADNYTRFEFVFSPVYALAEETDKNPLIGKTIMCFGDSIMEGNGNGNVGIGDIIAAKNRMTVFDYSKGGATITFQDSPEVPRSNIITQVELAISEHDNVDYIIFDGMTNDISGGALKPIGDISFHYAATLDKYTFSGALEYIIKTLRNKYKTAKIVYIRPHNMGSRNYDNQILYGNRAIEICNKWSVPVCDLYSESGLNTFLESMAEYTYNSDETHPTQVGYDLFYIPQITAKLKTL